MKISLLSVSVALTAILCGTLANAQPDAAAREACMGDYKSYCAGVIPGGGRVKKCLSDSIDKLTPACRSALEALIGKTAGQK